MPSHPARCPRDEHHARRLQAVHVRGGLEGVATGSKVCMACACAQHVPPRPPALVATPGWMRCCAALEAVDAGYERGASTHLP